MAPAKRKNTPKSKPIKVEDKPDPKAILDKEMLGKLHPVVQNEVKRILNDPTIQLLMLISKNFPEGDLVIKDIQSMHYRVPRQPPTASLLNKLTYLSKMGIIEWKKEGKKITITPKAEVRLPIEDAVMVVERGEAGGE